MEFKILEKNGVENENIDGAAFNRFCAGQRDGIIKGILDECKIISTANTIEVLTGELIIQGFRIKITSPYSYSFSGLPATSMRYQIVAQITLNSNGNVLFNIYCQEEKALHKDNSIFKYNYGIHEVELARFTYTSSGQIENLVQTLDVITGGSSGLSYINIGEVVTEKLPEGSNAEVDVNPVDRNGKVEFDFYFGIPAVGITLEVEDNLIGD